MLRLCVSAHGFRATAALLAAALAGTSLVPLAQAQEATKEGRAAEASTTTAASAKPGAATLPAQPKPPDAKTRLAAREAFNKGDKAFKQQRYQEAYDQFKTAEALIPSPQAEFWMARSLDELGKDADALAAYELFLKNPTADTVGAEKMAMVTERSNALRAKITAASPASVVLTSNTKTALSGVTINGLSVKQCDETRSALPCVQYVPMQVQTGQPAEGTVFFDAKGQPVNPKAPVTLWLPAGTYKVGLSAIGYLPKDVDVTVVGGQKLEQPVQLEAEPPPSPPPPPPPPPAPAAPPPPPPPEEKSMVPAYVTLGIATGAAAVGTIFGIKALRAKSDFDDKPTTDKADDVERNALIADMAFGVAVTLGITGIVLLTTTDEEPEGQQAARLDKPQWQLAPYASPTGGGAAARVTF
jgi:hypothetical protein